MIKAISHSGRIPDPVSRTACNLKYKAIGIRLFQPKLMGTVAIGRAKGGLFNRIFRGWSSYSGKSLATYARETMELSQEDYSKTMPSLKAP